MERKERSEATSEANTTPAPLGEWNDEAARESERSRAEQR